jgi:tocopherol O-methyltransferase
VSLTSEVAEHYDELDRFYRAIWGEHLHHGYWREGGETREEAVRALVREIAGRSGIGPGSRVCDVGCGYGAPARLLADEFGAEVLGFTVSAAQHAYAISHPDTLRLGGQVDFRLCDWSKNELASESFDHLIAIESTEHMEDFAGFFREASRVLRPGGRIAICAWLSAKEPKRWAERALLGPIRREGRLAQLASESAYREELDAAGLSEIAFEDISAQVKKTWPLSASGLAKYLLKNRQDLRFLLPQFNQNAAFARTIFRIWLAYESGDMRYGIFTAKKPVFL